MCYLPFFFLLLVFTTFDIAMFTANPSFAQLDACRKKDLYEVASFYGNGFSTVLSNAELKAALVSGLVEKGIFTLRRSSSSPGLAVNSVASQHVPLLPDQVVAPPVSTPIAQGLPENRSKRLPHFEHLSIES